MEMNEEKKMRDAHKDWPFHIHFFLPPNIYELGARK
jgi:hypothetical protein